MCALFRMQTVFNIEYVFISNMNLTTHGVRQVTRQCRLQCSDDVDSCIAT